MTYCQILEKTPFSIQYYPSEPYRPIAEFQLQMAEHDLRINAVHYYEWAVKIGERFFYPLEIAECIVSYWENRWTFADYQLQVYLVSAAAVPGTQEKGEI